MACMPTSSVAGPLKEKLLMLSLRAPQILSGRWVRWLVQGRWDIVQWPVLCCQLVGYAIIIRVSVAPTCSKELLAAASTVDAIGATPLITRANTG